MFFLVQSLESAENQEKFHLSAESINDFLSQKRKRRDWKWKSRGINQFITGYSVDRFLPEHLHKFWTKVWPKQLLPVRWRDEDSLMNQDNIQSVSVLHQKKNKLIMKFK